MLFDQVADVIAFGLERQTRKRAGDRHARRERRIFVDRERFGVSRYRHDALVGSRQHRATRAQLVEVGVRVRNQGQVSEEIDRFEFAQQDS